MKGHDDPQGPTIGEAAEYLNIRHHSTVKLVDRVLRTGLLRRTRDAADAADTRSCDCSSPSWASSASPGSPSYTLGELSRLAPVLRHPAPS